ncbi:MAG TPA: AMP-binding protein, partial [Thermoanaerobaculia bacterium]|nr:AMP-binding protein [Thermoanaerobaculia bacterium]
MTESSTLVDLLRSRARLHPDRVAYVFLQDGEAETARLTYRDLDERARAVAARLQQERAEPGDRALLLFPPGLEFLEAFFGCLYAGVIAVPSYPPRPGREQPRLRSIVEDSRPRFALATAGIAAKAPVFAHAADGEPAFAGLRWIVTEEIPSGLAEGWREPEVSGETLAFLQYTSGSTADPKGVEVSHGNLLFMEDVIRRAFELDEQSVIVGWLPVYHDMGLIGNVLQPLYVGAACVLMSPVAFLRRPRRWLEAISRYRGTTGGGPNFAYDLCVERIPESERAGLDLSSWRVAYNGAEPVRASTLERFAEAFAPYGFRPESFLPCYGLAEATLLVSGTVRPQGPQVVEVEDGGKARELVSCGPVPEGMRVEVVDPVSRERAEPGQEGELWVAAGPGVPRGYWNRPEVNREAFQARTADGDGPYLRTGDLGFLRSGELYVTGRLKDLIILRGRNHYPQDLELTAERSAPGLATAGGAAFSVEVDGEERLVIVQEVVPRLRPTPEQVEELAGAIRRAVAEGHEVQAWDVVVLRPGALPKTSSGKVQRQLCRRMYLEGTLESYGHSQLAEVAAPAGGGDDLDREALLALAPEDRAEALESWLRGLAARVLRVPAAELRGNRPLIELGLDS